MVKVTSEKMPDSQVRLNIEVEPDRIEKSVEKAYRKLAGQLNIPGFRRGKAPRHIVERFVGKETLFQEGLEQLLNDVYREAVQETDIHPIDQPKLDLEPQAADLKPGEPLLVKATVPVRPTVELGDYQSIRIPKVEVDVTPDELNRIVERVQEQETEWVVVERPVQENDRVTLDIRGEVGSYAQLYSSSGEPLLQSAGGKSIVDEHETEFEVSPESKRFPVNVSEQLVGMGPGQEKRFEASLPPDYPDAELANLAVIFQVKVHDVKEKRVPPIDDDLAKTAGFESLEQMREDLRRRAQEALEARARESYRESVISEAISTSTIEVPPSLIDHEVDHLVEEARESLRSQRLDLEDYLRITQKSEAELRADFREQAVRNVKSALVLERIAEDQSIEVSAEDVDHEIQTMADLVGNQADRLRQAMSAPNQREAIEYRLRRRRVIDFLENVARGGAEAAPGGEAVEAESAGTETAEPVAAEAESVSEAVSGEPSVPGTEADKE